MQGTAGLLEVLNRASNAEGRTKESASQYHEYGRKEPGQDGFIDVGVAHLPVMVYAHRADNAEDACDHQRKIQGRKEGGGQLLLRLLHFIDTGLGACPQCQQPAVTENKYLPHD
jgi:hypothetical protein